MNLSSSETNKQTSAENATPPETKGAESSSPDQEMETREFLHVRKNKKMTTRRDIIPSLCKDSPWVYFTNEGDPSDRDPEKCGKWMLFLDQRQTSVATGMTDLDDAWLKLIKMDNFQSTGICSAKCSTGMQSGSDNRNGVICCYIPDYTDKPQVKKAGDTIRKLVDVTSPIYFKTDMDTYEGKYRQTGHSNISLYKHTTDNKLYERQSKHSAWKLICFDDLEKNTARAGFNKLFGVSKKSVLN
ncbi:uncharacterized protein LOC129220355 isoform X2 [Uloborus diversus]|uniref:uncharacterized protein LOC129220355 isoform X2 n=1 Tax=Uloborus diversus TaxID=327109 RepID=UPI00240A1851|nr:uncharacterized protein LOC129220355 isoform X2 [Uloborus diversus]